ncbi:MAG: biotin/lipoyl-binding protein [Oscillospiraceae bacterium]|jgi:biotin carboxyl carrier protein|nr:biotin/lipoyl-binding protein [Oscillospiraceae bacterium]
MKYIVTLNGKKYAVEVDQTEAALVSVEEAPVAAAAPAAPAAIAAPVAAVAPAAAPVAQTEGVPVLAPMPGTILKVNVAVGDSVKAGQVLVILEAMKMENEIAAQQDGTVKQILAQKGASVNTDAVLLVI